MQAPMCLYIRIILSGLGKYYVGPVGAVGAVSE